MRKFLQISTNKGVSLYLALMVTSIILAIALGISSILLGQMKITKGMGESVVAFFAADTGIERALYENATATYSAAGYLDLNGNNLEDDGDAKYKVSGLGAGTPGCPTTVNFCIESIGTFKQTKRAIQITR